VVWWFCSRVQVQVEYLLGHSVGKGGVGWARAWARAQPRERKGGESGLLESAGVVGRGFVGTGCHSVDEG
jgi:hypothetical protein